MTQETIQPDVGTQSVPAPPLVTMRTLYDAGFALVPLGGGPDGKAPLVKFATRARLPFSVVVEKMRQAGSATYGVRTDELAVVDLDEDTHELRALAAERFGRSRFTVRTPRGRHLYFRHARRTRLPNPRAEGIAIDVKGGPRCFVVGPGSVRPDGGTYEALDVSPTLESLAPFRDTRAPDATSGANVKKPSPRPSLVLEGERTTSFLMPKALEFAWTAESELGLVEELRAAIDWHCDHPETIADTEVEKWGRWAWGLRRNNSLWTKGSEVVQLTWNEILALVPFKQGPDALVLLSVLRHNHLGRDRNGKPFAIAAAAMAEAGTIEGWKSSRIRRAMHCLKEVGLIRIVKRGGKYRGASLYMFGSLAPERGAEGGFLTLVPPVANNGEARA